METNDVVNYPVDKLRAIKEEHEQQFSEQPFNVDLNFLIKVSNQFNTYYNEIEQLHRHKHIADDYKISVDLKLSFFETADEIRNLLNCIHDFHDMLRQYDRINGGNNWEVLNLGLINSMTQISVKMDQLELFYLEKYVPFNANDSGAVTRLEELKESFRETVTTVGYVD